MDESFPFHEQYAHVVGDEIDLIIDYYCQPTPDLKKVPMYQYFMVLHEQPEQKVGRINLRIPPDQFHEGLYYGGLIGYEVFEQYRGKHFARKACKLIATVARSHNLQSVTITCEPTNLASKKTIESLGAVLLETVVLPEHTDLYKEGDRECSRFEWKIQ